MLKKKKMLARVTAFLMAFAVIVPLGGASFIIIGEPQLPKKIIKDSNN